MMQPCNKCPEWAQWRVRKPVMDDKKEKIIGWDLIALLCGTHKEEQSKMTENSHLRMDFIGAAPCR
jgi:hypothetical protein